jgi:hypothetical protein
MSKNTVKPVVDRCPYCDENPVKIDGIYGVVPCDECQKRTKDKAPLSGVKYELVPESVKESRKEYAKSLIQPYREGDFSKEYKEAYPIRSKEMVKDGIISQRQYDKAKYVWKDQPNWKNRNKTK